MTREPVLGLLPVIGIMEKLPQRPPRRDREPRPVKRRQYQYPRMAKQSAACEPHQADDDGREIAGGNRGEVQLDERAGEHCNRRAAGCGQPRFEKARRDQDRVGEGGEHIAADEQIEREESGEAALLNQTARRAHVDDPGLHPAF